MKRILSLTALLSCSLFLGGCMLLEAGPCHGYGCPAGTGGKYEVGAPANAPAPTSSAPSSAAATKSTPDRESSSHAGK